MAVTRFRFSLTMVNDHGTMVMMQEIAISKFKATCLSVLENVRKTRRPVVVTRFGEPVAQIVPPQPPKRASRGLGALAGTARIVGDIVSPAADESDWEALRR